MQQEFPEWFDQLAQSAPLITNDKLRWQPVPDTEERSAAVLILFGQGETSGEVVLIQRPEYMRSHAGQPAFPGGAIEDQDASPIHTALREANEETGLDPNSVTVITELPELWLSPSRFKVTPVLAWWHAPHELALPDSGEIAAVHRVSIDELLNPENRVRALTRSGFLGPAFQVNDMFVWGFTGGILSLLFDVAGWTIPWDEERIVDVPSSHRLEQ